jgi:hypothetical protein
MFDDWAAIMGGVLSANGIDGFLGNLDDFYSKADLTADNWPEFLSMWWEANGGNSVKAKAVLEIAGVAGLDIDGSVYKLGRRLSKERDRLCDIDIVSGKMRVKLTFDGTDQNVVLWKLERQDGYDGVRDEDIPIEAFEEEILLDFD